MAIIGVDVDLTVVDSDSGLFEHCNMLSGLNLNHEIVTILTGDHYDSKRHFLDRHFPFADALVCTKQKDFARIDMLVDDRVENLNACAKVGISPILFESAYAQTAEATYLQSTIKSWNHLLDDPRGVYNSLLSRRRVA